MMSESVVLPEDIGRFYKITWLINPKRVRRIFWEDLYNPVEESPYLEKNGSKDSVYMYMQVDGERRFVRGALLKRMFALMPLMVLGNSATLLLSLYVLLDSMSGLVCLFSMYFIAMLSVLSCFGWLVKRDA